MARQDDGGLSEGAALRSMAVLYRAIADAERALVARLEEASLRSAAVHGLPPGKAACSYERVNIGRGTVKVMGAHGSPVLSLPLVGLWTLDDPEAPDDIRIDGSILIEDNAELAGRELAMLRDVARGMTWSEDELAKVRASALAAAADPAVNSVADFRIRVVRGTRYFTLTGDD